MSLTKKDFEEVEIERERDDDEQQEWEEQDKIKNLETAIIEMGKDIARIQVELTEVREAIRTIAGAIKIIDEHGQLYPVLREIIEKLEAKEDDKN